MKFQLMLAPMEKVTDAPFRRLCHEKGADLTFTEVARVANLVRHKRGEMGRISIPDDTPTAIQLSGARPEEYATFLSNFEPQGGFRGFNINLGCSSPEFLRQGVGCALIKRVSRVDEIVRLVRAAGYECSVKMRLGLNQYEKDKKTYMNLIEKVDASFFVVHARIADQTLDDPADFSVYSECVRTGKRIVANGDISTQYQVARLREQGLYGVMIGRAAIGNPDIFRSLRPD